MPSVRVPIPADERRAMGKRLRGARWAVELSMRDVADRVGVTQNAVAQWEHGSVPTQRSRAALAKLLKVPADVLFAEYYGAVRAANTNGSP